MWPHTLTIAVDDTLVVVGTDDGELVTTLAPHVVTETVAELAAPRIDFGAELHPPRPEHRGAPRELPTVRHGTRTVGRTADLAALRDGLLRTLASLVPPQPAGHIRLSCLPLLSGDAIELASPDAVDHVAHRWLGRRGLTPVYVPSVLIDPQALTVRIEAPFGDAGAPLVLPLRRWWVALPAGPSVSSLSVGQMVAHTAHLLTPPVRYDEAADPAGPGSDALAGLVELVRRMPPTAGGPG